MEAAKSIHHSVSEIQNDALRFGLQGVKSEIVASHPLRSLRELQRKSDAVTERRFLEATYGSAMALRIDLDTQILSRFQRPPGALPSSRLGLEALDSSLDYFGFEDYLNDPRDSETFRPVDMHHGMEVRLGISKGPVCPSFL
ncbi:cyclin-B1-2-like isoform X1 [Aristolochia californica]|uniref:cyclin-B1-2-like isoform X1 n=1 Tax=Aristolochia californica TaxID=171875 RepID=UPI0035D583F6